MPPDPIRTSILAALGLTAAIAGCNTDTDTGPCLDFEVETDGDTDSTPDTGLGPCLDVPPDTGLGPCLDFDTDTDTGADSDTDTDTDSDTASSARRRVLERGVLPQDVSALLKNRR